MSDALLEIMVFMNLDDVQSFKSTTYEIQYFMEEIEKNPNYWKKKLEKQFEVYLEESYSSKDLKLLYLEELIKKNDLKNGKYLVGIFESDQILNLIIKYDADEFLKIDTIEEALSNHEYAKLARKIVKFGAIKIASLDTKFDYRVGISTFILNEKLTQKSLDTIAYFLVKNSGIIFKYQGNSFNKFQRDFVSTLRKLSKEEIGKLDLENFITVLKKGFRFSMDYDLENFRVKINEILL